MPAGERYTEHDIKRIREVFGAGINNGELMALADELDRSDTALVAKAQSLGLPTPEGYPQYNKPPKASSTPDKSYSEKLKHPKWQRKRLEIMSRDKWMCQLCYDEETTLHVHHLRYKKGADPWGYDNKDLTTLCEHCHEIVTEYDRLEHGVKPESIWDLKVRRCAGPCPITFYYARDTNDIIHMKIWDESGDLIIRADFAPVLSMDLYDFFRTATEHDRKEAAENFVKMVQENKQNDTSNAETLE